MDAALAYASANITANSEANLAAYASAYANCANNDTHCTVTYATVEAVALRSASATVAGKAFRQRYTAVGIRAIRVDSKRDNHLASALRVEASCGLWDS